MEIHGRNGVYFKAFVKNVLTDQLLVTFEHELEQERVVAFNDVRYVFSQNLFHCCWNPPINNLRLP